MKVLDFGLAKALDANASDASSNAMNSPTLTARATQMGMILGTAAYMAPEQARGRSVDRRADIWAFGVVLYEMLSGQRAFEGEDISITLAGVLKEDVKWAALPADLPPQVRRLLRRCLEKDPKRRLGAIGDARLELDEADDAPAALPTSPIAQTRSGIARWDRWILASVAAVAIAAALYFALRSSPAQLEPPVTARFAVPPPGTGAFIGAVPRFSISPDGRFLTFSAAPQVGQPDELWIRRLDATDVMAVPGTRSTAEAAQPQSPFWSPDNKTLAFFVQTGLGGAGSQTSRLQRVDLQGGAVQSIGDFPSNNGGGTWSRDGVILVSTQGTKGIQKIPSGGGVPSQVTTLDAATGEIAHLWPQFLPDGRHFIYQSQTSNRAEWSIFLGSLDSPVRRKLVKSEYARFVAPNTLLYIDAGNLLAQTMDASTQTLAGEPALVAAAIASMANGRAGFAASDSGVLVLATESDQSATAGDRRLTWVDRTGKPLETVGPPVSGVGVRLSPDGKRAIVLEPGSGGLSAPIRSVWIAELDRPVKTPVAADRPSTSAVWSADGLRVRFSTRDDAGRITIAERAASGATPATAVYSGKGQLAVPLDETQDGILMIAESPQAVHRSLFVLSKAGNGQATQYLSDSVDRPHASISRDGKWVAYASNEAGAYQIVVQPFPDPSKGKEQVSTNGGYWPRWSRDGRELFYVDPEQRLIAVEITTSPVFKVGRSSPLFTLSAAPRGLTASGVYSYDVAPDGKRFLISMPASGGGTALSPSVPLTVITNWMSLLKK